MIGGGRPPVQNTGLTGPTATRFLISVDDEVHAPFEDRITTPRLVPPSAFRQMPSARAGRRRIVTSRLQFVDAVPGVQQRQVVLADEVEKFRCPPAAGRAQGVDRVDGERWPWAVEFALGPRRNFPRPRSAARSIRKRQGPPARRASGRACAGKWRRARRSAARGQVAPPRRTRAGGARCGWDRRCRRRCRCVPPRWKRASRKVRQAAKGEKER